jgi:SAM-dependent methyltransferase
MQCRLPKRLRIALALILSVAWASHSSSAAAQSATAPAGRPTSTPYTGDLSIFDSPGRDQRLQIDRVMNILGITQGRTVADVGAGSGWFTVRAARRVMPGGTVYAVDINPEAKAYIEKRAAKEHLSNIKTIVSKPDDPLLPAGAIDAVLLLKTYHEVASPVALLQNVRRSLVPGGKLGIIDRNGGAGSHGVDREIVLREAAEAGYRVVQQEDFVKADGMDYFLVLTPKN